MFNLPGSTQQRCRRTIQRLAAAVCCLALSPVLFAPTARAEDGWDINVDVAVVQENIYPGAQEHYAMGVPAIEINRQAGAYTWFVSLPWRGIGVSRIDLASGLTASLSANFGGERGPEEYSLLGFSADHSERTRALLSGSPTVSTPLVVEAALEYPTRFGILGASLGYHPTVVEYESAADDEESRHGLLAKLQYVCPLYASDRFMVAGIAGIEFMDSAYADAWFSMDRPTPALAEFDAQGGMRDVQAALHAAYRASERILVSLYYRNELLLGDAADSPFTSDRNQQTVMVCTSYAF